ncbi:hypothetical protein PIB30_064669 [Stylosanthes scabra]|uniref:Uncharacterized protein n=1 Tax=Stylosanthes scabra TaxID=79078 RepID=A0ABU6TLH9_9FABA|nr:hypothetical protein [Stylosanthes scabra]
MGKKKSCQNVKVPRPLNAAERKLYGWVEEAIFTQPSVVLGNSLPELRRNMRLTEEATAEGNFVLEAAGPSDQLPLRADEDDPHFLWVYQELFTRLGVRLPFTDFQREVMTRPTSRLFLYIYDTLIPPTGYGFISFRARQGLLPAPGRRAFWLEGRPFPWVYWNREVKDFVIHELDPLEMAVFEFLVSLSAGLPKRNSLTCRWILDNDDTVVGKYLDDLLLVEMKKTKLDRMMEIMADPTRMAPRSVLPTGVPAATSAAAAPASAAPAGPSVPPPPPAASKAKKSSSKRERLEKEDVEVEETAKEDPDADLRQKRCQREKGKDDDIVDCVLGDDATWEHAVNPLDLAFPKKFNYWKALDAGLTSASLGLEAALKAKTKTEEELLGVKDQLFVLKLSQKEVERVAQLDEDIKVLKAQLESTQLLVSNDQKRAEAAESSVKSLTVSLETTQVELRKLREEADYWCTEWMSLGTKAQEMCHETLEIVLDQVSHLCPGVDFSAITLKTRWDPKGKRIYVLEELLGDGVGVAETLPEVVLEQQQE